MAHTSIDQSKIHQWMQEKQNEEWIRSQLKDLGYAVADIEAHLAAYAKKKIEKKQASGFYFLVTGALLGFISCVLTLVNPIPGLYYWILYGLTSLSIVVIFVGLYLVFE